MKKRKRKIVVYKLPMPIRSIVNFIRYRKLLKEFRETNNRELLDELINDSRPYFNSGVEFFWTKYQANKIHENYKKREALKRMSKDFGATLEEIQWAKNREIRAKEYQEKRNKEIEKRRRPEYDSTYRPTVNELLSRKVNLAEFKHGPATYKLFDIREKGAYVVLITIEGKKPLIFSGPDYKKVRDRGYGKWLEVIRDIPLPRVEEQPRPQPTRTRTRRARSLEDDVDISHVERAMGIDPNTTQNNNSDIDDLLDGLF